MQYVCMPMVIERPFAQPDWNLTTCPYCERECWDRPVDYETEKRIRQHQAVKVCRDCAIKKAVNPTKYITTYRGLKASYRKRRF